MIKVWDKFMSPGNRRRGPTLSPIPAMITVSLTGMYAIFGIALFVVAIPEANRDMINSYGAELKTAWLASIFYWIGTTRGGQNKDILLADSAPIKRTTDES